MRTTNFTKPENPEKWKGESQFLTWAIDSGCEFNYRDRFKIPDVERRNI